MEVAKEEQNQCRNIFWTLVLVNRISILTAYLVPELLTTRREAVESLTQDCHRETGKVRKFEAK